MLRFAWLLAGVAATFGLAIWTPWGQRLDSGLMGAGTSPLPRYLALAGLLRTGSLVVLAVLVTILGWSALWRSQWSLVIRCAVLTGASVGVALVMRRTLTRPEFGDLTYRDNTWPSGHVAAAAALIVSAVALAPSGWNRTMIRRIAFVVLVVVAGSSIATLAHRPSDVIGAVLLVAAFTAILLPTGALGWQALRRDVKPALWALAVAVALTVTPGLHEWGLLVNGAWLVAAALTTVGWGGRQTSQG